MNSLSIYIARSADRYVVVDQEPKADVVVGRHRDFRDRDEVQDLFEELEDVGVWRNLEKHHDAVDQLVVLEFTDESDVLLVVAVLVQHVAQQHAQQVARFPVRVLVGDDRDDRRDDVQSEQQRDVSSKHCEGDIVALLELAAGVAGLVVLVHMDADHSLQIARPLLRIAQQQHQNVVHGSVPCDHRQHGSNVDALDVGKELVRSHHQHEFEKEGNLVDVRIAKTVVVQEHLEKSRHDVALRGVQQTLQIHCAGHQKRDNLLAAKISEPRAISCSVL